MSPATSFCQSVPNPPMNVGTPWETIGRAANLPNGSMRVFHGAGTTEEENKAGQHSNTAHTSSLRLKAKGRMARSGEQRTGRQGATISGRFACNLGNPYAEKEARLRPQHFTFSRSRMGGLESDAHARGVAVTQRLPSVYF